MSIMDQADESDGSMKKEEVVMEKMKAAYKKTKEKKIIENIENGYSHGKHQQQKIQRIGKKKNGVNDDVTVTGNVTTKKRSKKENEKKGNEEKARSDSPGMDLSVFQPRGKRRCVIQNESKKAKEEWWSDDDEDEEKHDVDNNGKADVTDDENGEQPTAIKKKRKTTKAEKIAETNPVTKTVRCYVFSTGMANRAGHAVHKGRYASVTEYHHAQKWSTPYLSAEVHCRAFHPDLEEQEEVKDLAPNHFNMSAVKRDEEEGTKSPALDTETKFQPQRRSPVVVPRERLLSVDSWQKEQVIEAAKKMSGINDPQHRDTQSPRSLVTASSVTTGTINNVAKLPDKNNADSDSSPQTVPKFTEVSNKDSEKGSYGNAIFSHANTIFSIEKMTASSEDISRKKDLNSPPQLVPTFSQETVESKNNSYPADITNLKEQLRYHSPKRFGHDLTSNYKLLNEARDSSVRPTVLSMLGDRHENDNIRSTLDVAEKALKESRTLPLPYKHSGPILPRDVHPALFMSRHSPHTSAFNGHIPSSVMFSRHHSVDPFTSSKSLGVTSFQPPHTAEHFLNRNPPIIAPFRHPLHSPNGFQEAEKLSEKYKALSQFNQRPSSLPMLTSAVESRIPKSFSVESLTRVQEKDKTPQMDARNGQHDEALKLRIPPGTIPDRHFLFRDRLHMPQTTNLHNGVKRPFDEHLPSHFMERVHRDKKIFEHLHEEQLQREKERFLLDKERYIHHPRFPLHEPWSSASAERVRQGYVPRTLPNTNERSGDLPSPPYHATYAQMHRLNPFPFTNR